MTKNLTLITGAAGEMGHALINYLTDAGADNILATDLNPLDDDLAGRCHASIAGDITDPALMESFTSDYTIGTIYHLAALLSTSGERKPALAHSVNVVGTVNLLEVSAAQSRMIGKPITFIYPSSVAVYGLPDLETKSAAGAVTENQWNVPQTMYGVNKLEGEHLGRYYARHYQQLDPPDVMPVDFRSIRFPGLISAFTVPSGGTSDYGPEMVHAAAQGKSYTCFVRESARIPFMAMPDAVTALTQLAAADFDDLSQLVYNISSFNPSAAEIADRVRAEFPGASVDFKPDVERQGIVDGWPEDQDDSAARADWAWKPDYDIDRAFDEYIFPNIRGRYAK